MTTAIIHLGEGAEYRWETGDGEFLEGSIQRAGGDTASTLSFKIADPRLELANSLPLPNKNARVPVECWLGRTASPPKVFAGYLSQMTPSGTPGRLELMAVDKSKSLRRVARSRNLTASTPGDLLKRLCGFHGIEVDLSRANLDDLQFASVLQHGETDAEVVSRILGELGHVGHYQAGTLYVIDQSGDDYEETIRLVYGDNIRTYSFAIDELTRATTPNLYDMDGTKAAEDEDAEAVDRPVMLDRSTGLSISYGDFPSYTKQQLEKAKKAQARKKRVFEASIESTDCFPEASVKDAVVLEGFGDRLSGVWFIDTLEHDLVTGRTKFDLYNAGSGN